jgi:uncharacterized protein (UPF0332 family)
LLFKGFRPDDGAQHKTVVEFSAYFVPKQFKDIIDYFDKMRQKRNIFTYEIDISISLTEANNAINTARHFVELIKDIIKKESPKAEFNF